MNLISVNYHYIRENKPKNGIYPLSLSELSSQIDRLAKVYDFVAQSEVLSCFDNGFSSKGKAKCLLTFDDGLKEQMIAFDFLKEKGIPCVFYVPTDPLEFESVIDVHKIHHIRANLSDVELLKNIEDNFDLSSVRLNSKTLAEQYRYDSADARRIKYLLNFILKKEEKELFVEKVFSELVCSEKRFSKNLYMSLDDLIKLEKAGCLGTHSASHRPLGRLSDLEARADIEKSIDYLKRVVGSAPISISFPYGGTTALPNLPASYFESLGLQFGLTMLRGTNSLGEDISPFMLKRVDTNDALGGKNYRAEYYQQVGVSVGGAS